MVSLVSGLTSDIYMQVIIKKPCKSAIEVEVHCKISVYMQRFIKMVKIWYFFAIVCTSNAWSLFLSLFISFNKMKVVTNCSLYFYKLKTEHVLNISQNSFIYQLLLVTSYFLYNMIS